MPKDHVEALLAPGRQRIYRALRRSPMRGLVSPGAYGLNASDDPAYLWYRVTKVGSRTILAQLRAQGLHQAERHAMRYPYRRFRGHFAFAFVRNPWDRFVSCWAHRAVAEDTFGLGDQGADFAAFVDFVAGRDLTRGDPHLQLQVAQIDMGRVDFIGRFETFTEDLSQVFDRLGLDLDTTAHLNRSDHQADYRSHYTAETAAKVGDLYAADVDALGYSF